jgi:hypothetical protein
MARFNIDKMKKRKYTFFWIANALGLIIVCSCLNPAYGQIWDWAQTFGNQDNEAMTAIATEGDGDIWVAGTYELPFSIGSTDFADFGERDVWLAQLDANGNFIDGIGIGSPDDDEVSGLAIRPQGGLVWGGIFWDSIQYQTTSLYAPSGGKGFYLWALNEEEEVDWAISIDGTGARVLTDLAIDDAGNIYLAGHFKEDLFVGDEILTAKAERDLFLIKYSAEGSLVWVAQAGEEGDVRANQLALLPSGKIALAGHYRGTLILADDELTSDSDDEDGFLAIFSEDGMPEWGLKAGAQYEDFVNGLVVGEDGHLYLAGSFLGPLDIGGQEMIQTIGFNFNLFLAKITSLGEVVWVRNIGATDEESGGLLLADGNRPVLTGLFRQSLSIDGRTVYGNPSNFNAFVAGFEEDGQLKWMYSAPSDGQSVVQALGLNSEQQVLVAGSFNENVGFDMTYPSAGDFDAFLARLSELATPLVEVTAVPPLQIAPNPVKDTLEIRGLKEPAYLIRLMSREGRLLATYQQQRQISLGDLPPGFYILEVQIDRFSASQSLPFVKARN